MEKSTREKALEYWNSGRMKICQYDSAEKYYKGRGSNTLTGREIEHIYISEMAQKGETAEKLYSYKEHVANIKAFAEEFVANTNTAYKQADMDNWIKQNL